jgi:predicted methyltransferase
MLRTLLAAAVISIGATAIAAPAVAADAQLTAAVAAPHRGAANTVRDVHRHPAETLAFWGLASKQTVIEIAPGGGYWTEILAPYAKATGGRYVATASDLDNPNLSEAAKRGREAFAARFSDQAKYGVVELVNFGPQSKTLGPANSADLVFTSRNVHNFMYQNMLDKVLADIFAVLKPGGVMGVEEHRSDPRPEAPGVRDGYVSTATVIAAAEKAGFKLAAQSEINANPKDTKDHPFGVWTLPPNLWTAPNNTPPNPSFDNAKFKAIGESDRMTLKFVKPR